MRNYITILMFVMLAKPAICQQPAVDSFGQMISQRVADSFRQILGDPGTASRTRVIALKELSYNILFSKPDSAMLLAQEGKRLAREINYPAGEILCEAQIGSVWWIMGDYTKANEIFLNCLKSSEEINDTTALVWSLAWLASGYRDEGNFQEALKYCKRGMNIPKIWTAKVWNTVMGSIYQAMIKPDSALIFLLRGDLNDGWGQVVMGHTHAALGNEIQAADHYKKSIPLLSLDNNLKDLAYAYIGLARLHEKKNEIDSSIYYAQKGFIIAQNASFKKWLYETCLILSRVNEKNDPRQALYYHKLAISARDSMFNLQHITQFLNSRFNEQFDQLQAESARISYKNKIRIYIFSILIGFLILLALILWKNNRQKQKSKTKIEKAYTELKATQQQLIQSEKMASLGELTAGIAHEIQNPLNFVNIFSEVSNELVDEMKSGLAAGNMQLANEIADDIKQNLEKINHHGKRADAIVKGMLQHSRSSTGQKEPTGINALCDEYLRLAYHGFKAKDRSFNATMKTNFDESIGKINVIPQDMGRVILNLINNAFYAVDERRKQQGDGYEPTVSVSTKQGKDKVEVKVKDNGNGIPQKVLDKIFQPFFTTKPTGQGTGLGLSLAYDIVKAHGGELRVITNEGEGSEFIIQIPVNR